MSMNYRGMRKDLVEVKPRHWKIIHAAYREIRNDPKFPHNLEDGLNRLAQEIIREERKTAAKNLLRLVKDWVGKQERQ